MYFNKDVLDLGPADSALFVIISDIPWYIKPLYGFISDGYPLWGLRRKPYLVAASFLGTIGWVYMGTLVAGCLKVCVARIYLERVSPQELGARLSGFLYTGSRPGSTTSSPTLLRSRRRAARTRPRRDRFSPSCADVRMLGCRCVLCFRGVDQPIRIAWGL
jgi:hypothetical protein